MVIVSKSEVRKIKNIERIIGQSFERKDIPDGMEICEVQLFHLANDIKKTEINHEIDRYLPSINDMFEGLTKEELLKKFFSVEFTRFFNYYNNAQDLNAKAAGDTYVDDSDSTRFFINVGAKDDFDWMSLKDFLKATLDLGRDDVNRVEVKDSFSFFNVDSSKTNEVIAIFENFQLHGRHINVEVTKNSAGKDRGRKSFKGKDKGRSFEKSGAGKGRRRSESPVSGKRRSSDSGDRKSKKSGGRSNSIESSIKRRRSKK